MEFLDLVTLLTCLQDLSRDDCHKSHGSDLDPIVLFLSFVSITDAPFLSNLLLKFYINFSFLPCITQILRNYGTRNKFLTKIYSLRSVDQATCPISIRFTVMYTRFSSKIG
jgi:hypothetical protein